MIFWKDGYKFRAPSRNKMKKYDVILNDEIICSFGSLKRNHFYDKIGYYRMLDNNDEEKRKKRQAHLIYRVHTAGRRIRESTFEYNYLC